MKAIFDDLITHAFLCGILIVGLLTFPIWGWFFPWRRKGWESNDGKGRIRKVRT
jgi:hypothetical protein